MLTLSVLVLVGAIGGGAAPSSPELPPQVVLVELVQEAITLRRLGQAQAAVAVLRKMDREALAAAPGGCHRRHHHAHHSGGQSTPSSRATGMPLNSKLTAPQVVRGTGSGSGLLEPCFGVCSRSIRVPSH